MDNESILSVSIDEGLIVKGMLNNSLKNIVKMVIIQLNESKIVMLWEKGLKQKNETIEEENERLKKENLYLKAKLEYLKEVESGCSGKEESMIGEKVNVVREFWLSYPLMIFLKVSSLTK